MGAPSTVSTSRLVSGSPSGSSSSRATPASFHSERTASGSSSPVRTVTITKAALVSTRCRTSAADVPSSSCASSTPSTIGRPPARSRSRSAIPRITSSVLPATRSSGISAANAPSGTAAALRVACTHAVWQPSALAAATAWRARLDLPTPAAAPTTTPGERPGPPERRDLLELAVATDQRPFERLRRGGRAGRRDAGAVPWASRDASAGAYGADAPGSTRRAARFAGVADDAKSPRPCGCSPAGRPGGSDRSSSSSCWRSSGSRSPGSCSSCAC